MTLKEMLSNKIWRFFSAFWGVLYLFVVCADFASENIYGHVLGPLGTVYIATLAIFVGGKEFDRWHKCHLGKRRGELFVVAFTAILFVMFAISFVKGVLYRVPADVSATYVAVLSVFVISQKSKELHKERKREIKEKDYESSHKTD